MDSSIVIGIVVVGALFAFALVRFVLFLVGKVHDKNVALLEPEGILLRSGRVRVYLKLRGYRGTQVTLSSMTSIRMGELVLTKQGLVLVMPYAIRIGAPPWTALTVDTPEGKLHLVTEQPPEATGKVELTAPVADLGAWVAALKA